MATATSTPSYAGPYAGLVNSSARANGLDPWLLAALLWVENRFRPKGDSSAGAVGIAQIQLSSHPDVTRAQAEDPTFAIPWAARYLASLKKQAGSAAGALRAYNTGSSAPSAAGNSYVSAVYGAYSQLRGTSSGASSATSSSFTPGTTPMTPGGTSPYANLTFQPWVDWRHVSSYLLRSLNWIAQTLGVKIDLTSGYRSDVYSQQHGGFAGDPHTKGIAVDAYINGTPIGNYPGVKALLARFGIRSGAQPNFYNGKPDPEHLDLVGNPKAQSADFTIPTPKGLPDIHVPFPDVPNPLTPFKGLVDVFSSFGHLTEKFLNDPAYPFLWLLFMLIGFAMIFMGLTRLVGKGAGSTINVFVPPTARGAGGGEAGAGAAEGGAAMSGAEAAAVMV